MKKIDLHVHTKVAEGKDRHFDFDLDEVKNFVDGLGLDAIAITNHNTFDLDQFKDIVSLLPVTVSVFPGIEIDFEGGHMLLISENKNLVEFNDRCELVESESESGYLSLKALEDIFPNLKDYLLIPHYKKDPVPKEGVLDILAEHIFAGEVSSPKKFFKMKKVDELTPVYFSDARIEKDMDIEHYQGKQTFLNTNVETITLENLKISLKDKDKVFLTSSGKKDFFQISGDGQEMSGGLNLVLGKRSSGKTHFLDGLDEMYSEGGKRIKYIRQGALTSDDGDDEFDRKIEKQEGVKREEYLKEFKPIVTEMSEIDLNEINFEIGKFLESLKTYASDAKTHDTCAKATLYSESIFSINSNTELPKLIGSVFLVKNNKTYKKIINSRLTEANLVGLVEDLEKEYKTELMKNIKKSWINELCTSVKQELNSQTSATDIEFNDTSFYKTKIDVEKIRRFKAVASKLREKSIINKEPSLGKFSIQTSATKYNSATELKKESGVKDTKFADAFKYYESPMQYLEKIKDMKALDNGDLYKFFCRVSHQVLNEYGKGASGGEKAEFNLLKELNDARQYEMLFIDEPESSFDNLFLLSDVNKMIKDISIEMPVAVVTHNSTVGMLLKPNYILYAKREGDGKKDEYYLFSGSPGEKEFETADGCKKEASYEILLDTLEAGPVPYDEKRDLYCDYKK
jgi:hypothetical protein